MTRVIFMGTPDFAVPALQALAQADDFEIVGVVTQPDRPAGRGQTMRAPAVKEFAVDQGLPVFQPKTLRDEAAVAHLQNWDPDVLVVAAFGQILRQPVLEMAPWGSVNIHASLLPRWRGAAPIQYAIRAGDAQTGVTIMKMDVGLDTGPIVVQEAIPIAPDETGASLHDRLADLGARMIEPALRGYLAGEISPQPQPDAGVTLAPTLKKEEGQIDWSQSAQEIDRHVRAFYPWPGTFTFLGDERMKIIEGHAQASDSGHAHGALLVRDDQPAVQTGSGLYLIERIQPAGKNKMTGQAYLAGHADVLGQRLALKAE